MKQYYYADGLAEKGPFSLEELGQHPIRRDTMVWYSGLGDWQRADTVPELGALVGNMPPSAPQGAMASPDFQKGIGMQGDTIDTIAMVSLVVWLLSTIASATLRFAVDEWYRPPYAYISIFFSLVLAFLPVVLALSIRKQSYKVAALVVAVLIALYQLYLNIDWLINLSDFY